MLEEIKGQSRARRLLEHALSGERLAHAFLFAGPDGVGKTTTARQVAQIVLCRNTEAPRPCDSCRACIKFRSGNHPDFVSVGPDGAFIKIDQIRKLKEAVTYPPLEGRRVILLQEVQTLRREAANSLLKLLEEPPPDNYFFLIGTSAQGILPTIASRCQVIPFTALPISDAADIIARESGDITPDEANMMAQLSEGCPGQALTMETGGLFELFQRFKNDLLQNYPNEEALVESALALAADLAELKESLPLLFRLFRVFYRDIIKIQLDPDGRQSAPAELLQARELWNFEDLSAKMASIDLAERALAGNCNRGLCCEVLVMDLFDRQTNVHR